MTETYRTVDGADLIQAGQTCIECICRRMQSRSDAKRSLLVQEQAAHDVQVVTLPITGLMIHQRDS